MPVSDCQTLLKSCSIESRRDPSPKSSGKHETKSNKKVLLHGHKRHTTHHLASTCSAVLSLGEGGTPVLVMGVPQSWLLGYPNPDQESAPVPASGAPVLARECTSPRLEVSQSCLGQGVPQSCPGWGYHALGYPLAGTVVPPARTGERTWDKRPGKEPGTGYPPWMDTHLWKKLPSPSFKCGQ